MAEDAIALVEEQQWLQPVAESLTGLVHRAFDSGGDVGRRVKNALHGVWLGHPLHPVLTDIPLGAWTTALVLDAAESTTGDRTCARAADTAVAVGLAGAVGAAVTGLTDWSETDGGAKRLGLVHGLMNTSAAALYVASLAMRRSGERASGRALGFAGFVVACAAAYLGGGLVYRERIGVTHADAPPEQLTEVADSDALGDGDMRQVDAAGTAVFLARQHGRVCALAEHCSHLGGPLSEGTLRDGSIVCPWHGSEFALEDGHVINGPATHPQPCYRVQEREGRIAVGGGTV